MESLDNIDMLLANMKTGNTNREQAIHRLGEKYSIFEEQDAKKRLIEQDANSNNVPTSSSVI